MTKWIRKGDKVVVIAGNDKGKVGEVLSRSEERVLVQGVNVRKKHMRRTQETQGGRIIDMEVPIHISNVALCDAEGTKIKVRVKKDEAGEKKLVYLKGGQETVYRSVNKPV